jgi:hypothetical protein
MATSARVPGHTLIAEGAPFAVVGGARTTRTNPMGTGGSGRGLCTCGEWSPMLDSSTQRKQWHREHKAAVQ